MRGQTHLSTWRLGNTFAGTGWRSFRALGIFVIGAFWLVPIDARSADRTAANVERLIEELGDENAYVRRMATEALARSAPHGKVAIEPLIQALGDEDAGVRSNAAAALEKFGPEASASAPALIAALKDEIMSVRRSAATALGKIEPEDPAAAAAALIEAAQVEGSALRAVALPSLAALGPKAVPVIAERTLSPDITERIRLFLIAVLAGMGSESSAAAPALVEMLKLDSPNIREWAVRALSSYKEDAVKLLAAALVAKDLDFRARRMAASALAQLGRYIKSAVPDLVKALGDDDPWVRQYSVRALGYSESTAAAAALILVLQDQDILVRREAVSAISQLGEAATSELLKGVTREEIEIRRYSAQLLGRIARDAEIVVPVLMEAMSDEDISVRWIAIKSLGKFRDKAGDAAPLLDTVLKREQAYYIRREAIDALSKIGPAAEAALPGLLLVLEDQEPELRQTALKIVGKFGPKAAPALPLVKQWLDDKDLALRKAALDTWARLKGAEAVPELLLALQDENGEVRQQALNALARMQPIPRTDAVVPALIATLSDEDPKVRAPAVGILGRLGRDSAEAVPNLTTALEDEDRNVRIAAVRSLTRAAPDGRTLVPTLVKLLNDEDKSLRLESVKALGQLGPAAGGAVPELIGLLESEDPKLPDGSPDRNAARVTAQLRQTALGSLVRIGLPARDAFPALLGLLRKQRDRATTILAVSTLGGLATKLLDANAVGAIDDLTPVRAVLVEVAQEWTSPVDQEKVQEALQDVERAIRLLEDKRWEVVTRAVLDWIREHPILSAGLPLYLLWALAVFSILWLRPLALLPINRALRHFDLTLPAPLSGVRLPLSSLLLAGLVRHHPRVLDAWVGAKVATVREKFGRKHTVQDRWVHIDMPVVIDGNASPALKQGHLRPTFEQRLGCLLIWGEGGAGKTSLACQIAKWAMAEEPEERLCRHLMLPVLVEHELGQETPDNQSALTEAIAKQVQDLTDQAEPIPEHLLRALLTQRRVLVIVDHLSEMSEGTRAKINPQLSDFPVNALIVTSRLEESLGGVTKTSVKPMRIAGNRLSSFMEAYLLQQGVRELFEDREFFQACSQLSAMVGDRDITLLLAKLYAEELISQKRRSSVGALPGTVPDLMLGYLNELNRAVTEDRVDDRSVHRDAKAIAWECMKGSLRPGMARHEDALAALDPENGEARLRYLEERLRLVQYIQPAQDHIRLVLDPLAEYLAGLHLIDLYGEDEQPWRDLIERAQEIAGGPEVVRGFLLAIRDCCLAHRETTKTPEFVVPELSRLAGMVKPSPSSRAA